MQTPMYRILLALKDPESAAAGEDGLRRDGHAVTVSPAGEALFDALLRDEFDLVVADLALTQLSLVPFLRRVEDAGGEAELIVALPESENHPGLRAANEGAFDFVELPLNPEHLRLVAWRALERRRLRHELISARELLQDRSSPMQWLDTPTLAHLRAELLSMLSGNEAVFFFGEPGTETAECARLLHLWGTRAGGPFVSIPTALYPNRDLEEALRGMARADGIVRRRPGWFERAHGGTLFFEDVTRLSMGLQEWLVSVIETGAVLPIGATSPVRPNVRILGSIHQDPEVATANDRLHPGLYEILRHRRVSVPPLRERPEDLEPIVQCALQRVGLLDVRLTEAAHGWLRAHRWPGNRTELEATLLRGVLDRRQPDRISLTDFDPTQADSTAPRDFVAGPERWVRDSLPGPEWPGLAADEIRLPEGGVDLVLLERQLIEEALARTEGNQTRAARLLGLTRQTLIYRMQKYGIR